METVFFFHAIWDQLIYQRHHVPDVGKFREMAVNALTRNPLTPAGVHFPRVSAAQCQLEGVSNNNEERWNVDNTMVHVMVDALDSTINVATSEEWHNVYHAIQTVSPRMWLTTIFGVFSANTCLTFRSPWTRLFFSLTELECLKCTARKFTALKLDDYSGDCYHFHVTKTIAQGLHFHILHQQQLDVRTVSM